MRKDFSFRNFKASWSTNLNCQTWKGNQRSTLRRVEIMRIVHCDKQISTWQAARIIHQLVLQGQNSTMAILWFHCNIAISSVFKCLKCQGIWLSWISFDTPSIGCSVLQFWSGEGLSPLCKLTGNSAQVQAQCSNEATVGSCNVPVPLPLFPGTVEISEGLLVWNNVSQDCHVYLPVWE